MPRNSSNPSKLAILCQQCRREKESELLFDSLEMCQNEIENDGAVKADSVTTSRAPNPYKESSFLSKMLFMWPYPLLKLGMERPLEDGDLPESLEEDGSRRNRLHLEKIWQDEKDRHPEKPSLHRAILKDFLKSLWYVQPMMMAATIARVVQAVALGWLLESFSADGNGYWWAGILVLCALVILFEHHQVFLMTWHKGMQLRIASVAAIYDKSLRLSSTHQDVSASSGRIINLATNDVERYLMASLFINYLFWGPVQSLAILAAGISELGPAFIAGFALLLVVVVPLQMYLAHKFAYFRSKVASMTDQRVNLVSQTIYGARVMKMSGWEWQFLSRIEDIRAKEIAQIKKANMLKAWNEALFFATNVIVSICIFLTHVAFGGTLTTRNVFTTVTLVNVVQLEMTKHVSLGVMVRSRSYDIALCVCFSSSHFVLLQGTSECYVSIKRIQGFMEYPELRSETTKELEPDHDVKISLENVTCYWNERTGSKTIGESDRPVIHALSNVSLACTTSSLTCVIGVVGSGKSALLQTMVGEMPVGTGNLRRNYETIAYAAQDPWIMGGTVRENIVMGLEMDEAWYRRVVLACGLDIDFQQFRNGDMTIVGDRGVQCSGGQRARIGLARALYRDADVLICDDPLSAVDAKVGRLIFSEAIMKLGVERGKCVVLATHQHQYIGENRCVLVVDGRVKCIGTYSACVQASGGKLTTRPPDSSVDTLDSKNEKNETDETLGYGGVMDKIGEADGKEMNVKGLVRFDTFVKYTQAMGGAWIGVVLLLLFTATQAPVLVTIAFLGRWAERSAEDQRSGDIIGLVVSLGLAVLVLGLIRAVVSFRLTVRASQRLHDRMTRAVLRAKVEFFDTNPLGRILNRFSADVGSNDDLLPHTLFDFLMIAFVVLGAMVTSVSVLPFTLAVVPPLLWYFLSVRRIFVTTTRELKRLEGLARSPIFAMLSESLSGISTIRSNDYIQYFRKRFEVAHDAHSRAFFAFIASSRWVGFRMDSIMVLFLSVACFLSVVVHRQGWFDIDPAILGLALSMLLQLAGVFQWCIRQSAEVINQMVSVERVLGFGGLPPEADLEKESDKELATWPREGRLSVKGLSVRYRESLPLSLDKISFEIPSGSRVGVVGRTGSGKSTLVQALFRLLEAEEGSIEIDGVNVADVGLHCLRKRLSVIPQVPVLFSGCTVRENLDPFNAYSDDAVTDALRDVHMLDVVMELPGGLSSMVAEGGSNFSVGQRQLLCLARAILRKNRFLILDEPTANVDRRTDELLQEALSKSFPEATIISVAHRLDTVIDNDLILVLGHGKVLEFGSPADLVEKHNGHFAGMVRDTGTGMAEELRNRALAAGASKQTDTTR